MKAKMVWHSIFVFIIGILFYFGGYNYLNSTESSSHQYEYIKTRVNSHYDADTLIIGDSTAGNDFRPNYFNNHSRHKAVTLGMPGSWFFTQDKLASFAKRNNKHLKSVILFIGPDSFTASSSLKRDFEYCKNSLSLADIYTAWRYKDGFNDFFDCVAHIVFRPFLFQADLQDLVQRPGIRVKMVLGNVRGLTAVGSPNDLQYEDERSFSVCGIGDFEQLPEKIKYFKESGNKDEQIRYEWNFKGYLARKKEKVIKANIKDNLDNLIGMLSSNFDRVFVVNSPVYSGFHNVYPASYLYAIETLTRSVAGSYSNVTYIPIENLFLSDCSNYLDVVHLNSTGSERLTNIILNYTDQDSTDAQQLRAKKEVATAKSLAISEFGPDIIKANTAFNVQPSGRSAIWVRSENATPSTVIVINNKHCKSAPQADGHLVTAEVPAELYRRRGNYSMFLYDTKTCTRSNAVIFRVQ